MPYENPPQRTEYRGHTDTLIATVNDRVRHCIGERLTIHHEQWKVYNVGTPIIEEHPDGLPSTVLHRILVGRV